MFKVTILSDDLLDKSLIMCPNFENNNYIIVIYFKGQFKKVRLNLRPCRTIKY